MRMRKHLWTFGQIMAGAVLLSIAIQLLLVPNNLVTGGISGLAIILHYFTGWPTGVLIFLINAPIFLFALRQLGLVFLLTALAGVAMKSILVDLLAPLGLVITEDLLLVAIYSGALIGAGVALLFRAGSCSGGVDLLSRLIRLKRPDLTIGWLILLIDGVIIIAGALVFWQIELALYAVISAYVLKRVVDALLKSVYSKETEAAS